MSEILNTSIRMLDYVIGKNAPNDTGNLSQAIKSTPIVLGNMAIINLGQEWSSRAFKSKDYNYGQLLNDKRVIRNRESKNVETRIRNREQRRFTNTRSVWVKDKRYGNTIRITNRQYQRSVEKSRVSKKYQQFNETKDYIFLRNDTSIPTNNTSIRPTRTNRHYGYMDVLFNDYCVELARTLGGKLHKGDYYTKSMIKNKMNESVTNIDFSNIGYFDQLHKSNINAFTRYRNSILDI